MDDLALMNNFIRYNLQEHYRHGEAGSVDLAAVKEEQVRVSKVLAKYAPKNRLNFNESGLFGLFVTSSASRVNMLKFYFK